MNNKLVEIIKLIEEDPRLERFKRISKLINEDNSVLLKIEKIKEKQQQIINAKHIQKKNAVKLLEEEYDYLLEELKSTPLLSEYFNLLEYYNALIKAIEGILEDGVNNFFKVL